MKRSTFIRTALVVALTIPVATFAATTATTAKSTTAKNTTSTTATKESHHSHHGAPKVNVNTATREQLMALPGVDDAMAQKIIAARPFHSVDQLLKQNIMTKQEYEKVHAHLMAKPASSETTKK
jgi:DNA uptake protein ComE-like DNA-binding protein